MKVILRMSLKWVTIGKLIPDNVIIVMRKD